MERSELKRGKGLKAGKPMARLKALSPMSAKRRKENSERRRAVLEEFGSHPRCTLCPILKAAGIETGCNGWADDADEIKRRSRGGSITDVSGIRPIGRRCHQWIGANVALAAAMGLTLHSWEEA